MEPPPPGTAGVPGATGAPRWAALGAVPCPRGEGQAFPRQLSSRRTERNFATQSCSSLKRNIWMVKQNTLFLSTQKPYKQLSKLKT